MALTTTVTPAKIAVAMGQSAPVSDSPREQQLSMWIADALRFIQRRVTQLEISEETLDQDDIDYVVRQAVVAHAGNPDATTQTTTTVDDGTVSKSRRAGKGEVEITGEWWALLGLASTKGKAFMVDLMPPGAGIGGNPADGYWWSQ